jgi:hypothetical protein
MTLLTYRIYSLVEGVERRFTVRWVIVWWGLLLCVTQLFSNTRNIYVGMCSLRNTNLSKVQKHAHPPNHYHISAYWLYTNRQNARKSIGKGDTEQIAKTSKRPPRTKKRKRKHEEYKVNPLLSTHVHPTNSYTTIPTHTRTYLHIHTHTHTHTHTHIHTHFNTLVCTQATTATEATNNIAYITYCIHIGGCGRSRDLLFCVGDKTKNTTTQQHNNKTTHKSTVHGPKVEKTRIRSTYQRTTTPHHTKQQTHCRLVGRDMIRVFGEFWGGG